MTSAADQSTSDPLEQAVNAAEVRLEHAAEQGLHIPEQLVKPILSARDAAKSGISWEARQAFYAAYAGLSKLVTEHQYHAALAPDPITDAINDAEKLLGYAAEMSIEVPTPVASDILAAHTAVLSNTITDETRGAFYAAYTKLSALFGGATVQTIEECRSPKTGATLQRNKWTAVILTFVIAFVSIVTFIADDQAKRIATDISRNDDEAAKLRAALGKVDEKYVKGNVCELIAAPPSDARQGSTVDDVTQLQGFAARSRNLERLAKKLDRLILNSEKAFDPYPDVETSVQPSRSESKRNDLQINPAIGDYTAEVLCKIRSYQDVRSFANAVQSTYSAWYGGIVAYALPVFYALLGAYAFRLRLFGDTIRKRTYHPSFADSARMITAVIAGAIVSLFYPAQGASLSPLAISFLIGYAVEVFFKLLDGAINSLGSSSVVGQRPR